MRRLPVAAGRYHAVSDCWRLSADDGLSVLTESLGVASESDAQVKFRLGWLENLGVATQRGGRWELVRNRDTE